jgi:murein L,D-transpeptidase YcbB/YkuD
VEFDDLQPLRRAGGAEDEAAAEGVSPQYPPGAGISPNAIAHLVADLVETTGLISLDRLAQARSSAGAGSLAEAIMDDPRVKYVISNRQIYNPSIARRWRPYNGANPHTLHFHVSVLAEKRHYDNEAVWQIAAGGSTAAPAAPTSASPGTSRPLLRQGAKGDHVRDLQRLLNRWIPTLAPLVIDGDFGPLTLARVRLFQVLTGLVLDGIVGPYTWEKLEK